MSFWKFNSRASREGTIPRKHLAFLTSRTLAAVLIAFASITMLAPRADATPPPDYVALLNHTQTGNFAEYINYSGGTLAGYCYFAGSSPDMTSQSGSLAWKSCANTNRTAENLGFTSPGSDVVRLYYGQNYTGAYTCLSKGWYWEYQGFFGHTPNSAGATFGIGKGQAGYGQTVWNNVASMKWGGGC